jgi:hypothetical protein
MSYRWTITRVAAKHGYVVRFLSMGPENTGVGAPTQMGVFQRAQDEGGSDG